MNETVSKESNDASNKAFRGSHLVFVLVTSVTMGAFLYPSLSEKVEQEQKTTAAFESTYSVESTRESRYGFFVKLKDGTSLTCDKPDLKEIESREPVKCTDDAKGNAVMKLEAKK